MDKQAVSTAVVLVLAILLATVTMNDGISIPSSTSTTEASTIRVAYTNEQQKKENNNTVDISSTTSKQYQQQTSTSSTPTYDADSTTEKTGRKGQSNKGDNSDYDSWISREGKRKWDSMSIKEFHILLTTLIDHRIAYHHGSTESTTNEPFNARERQQPLSQLQQQHHDELIAMLQTYNQQLSDLTERVRLLEKEKLIDDVSNTSTTSTNAPTTTTTTQTTTLSTTQTTRITTQLIDTDNTTTQIAETSHDLNTDDASDLIIPAVQRRPIEIDLSNNSRTFLQSLLANFTAVVTMAAVKTPVSLNITMGVDTHVLLPYGNHTILLEQGNGEYQPDQDVQLTLETALGVNHLTFGCPVFDLEEHETCEYDYLLIDNDVKYCGQDAPINVLKQHRIHLDFHSDPSNNGVMRCHVVASV